MYNNIIGMFVCLTVCLPLKYERTLDVASFLLFCLFCFSSYAETKDWRFCFVKFLHKGMFPIVRFILFVSVSRKYVCVYVRCEKCFKSVCLHLRVNQITETVENTDHKWVSLCVYVGMSGLRIGCFACVDSILTIVLVKIYTFYCSMFTFFLLRPYKTIGFVYFSCFSVPVLAVFVVVIACTCLSVCVFRCVFAALLLVDRFVLFLY